MQNENAPAAAAPGFRRAGIHPRRKVGAERLPLPRFTRSMYSMFGLAIVEFGISVRLADVRTLTERTEMATLLRIDSSPIGEASISRELAAEFERIWRRANPDGRVIARDVTTTAIPTVTAAWVAAHYTPAESRAREQHELLRFTQEIAQELLDADEYVMGVPTHNWGPPASFKLWVDHFTSPFGPRLEGKRATFIITAGRSYGPGSGNEERRHVEPWLRTLFGGLGVADVHFVFVDATAQVFRGAVDRAEFLGPHVEVIHAMIPQAVPSG